MQIVKKAEVRVDDQTVGAIGRGLLILLGVARSLSENALFPQLFVILKK
jgi:D-Tyr-tRNAtyr deacylase